ncbi:MAG: DUF6924 domain-containing protein [Planctomycetota bacterium]
MRVGQVASPPNLLRDCKRSSTTRMAERLILSSIQSIENNLSIGNMDFQDFANNTDSEGIFRGLPS